MANDWEYVYNSLTFGGATNFGVIKVEGLSRPDSREDVITKAIDHGAFAYTEWLPERRITFECDVHGVQGTNFHTRVDQLRAALVPRASTLPLVYKLPGEIQKRINCIPVKTFFDVDEGYELGLGAWTAQFLAEDPRIYDDNESTLNGDGTANNAGTFQTLPYVTVVGPCTNPTITNTTTGKVFKLNMTVSGGQTLIIDFPNRQAKLSDETNVYYAVDTTSSWWPLQPGDNVIDVAGGGTWTTKWRSAWV